MNLPGNTLGVRKIIKTINQMASIARGLDQKRIRYRELVG